MFLRRRTYLVEATYQRDKAYRDTAEDFYYALVKFLKTRPEQMEPRESDGGFLVYAMQFWRHPLARKLAVVFTPRPKMGVVKSGIGTAGSMKVLVFPVMMGPGDRRYLDTRLNKDIVVHEMVHCMDPGFGKARGSAKRFDAGNAAGYYNTPGEWNAYWQEGAAKFERLLSNDGMRSPQAFKTFFGDGSLEEIGKRVKHFWEPNFIESMSTKTSRKFDKRLAQLWKEMKKKGLL